MIERRRNAILAPGFASDGRPWKENVAPFLKENSWQTYQIASKKRFFLKVRLCDGNIADAVASLTPEGAVGWGHSDGANLLVQAARLGARFSQLVLINAALDADVDVPAHVRVIHNWHAPKDLLLLFGGMLLVHPWGLLGRDGRTIPGKAGQVWINYNMTDHFPGGATQHNDALKDAWPLIGPHMLQRVEYYREKMLAGEPL